MSDTKPARPSNWFVGLIALSGFLPDSLQHENLDMRVYDWKNTDDGVRYTVEVSAVDDADPTWMKTEMRADEVMALFHVVGRMSFRGKKEHIMSFIFAQSSDLEVDEDWEEIEEGQLIVNPDVIHNVLPPVVHARAGDRSSRAALVQWQADMERATYLFLNRDNVDPQKLRRMWSGESDFYDDADE